MSYLDAGRIWSLLEVLDGVVAHMGIGNYGLAGFRNHAQLRHCPALVSSCVRDCGVGKTQGTSLPCDCLLLFGNSCGLMWVSPKLGFCDEPGFLVAST